MARFALAIFLKILKTRLISFLKLLKSAKISFLFCFISSFALSLNIVYYWALSRKYVIAKRILDLLNMF